MKTSQIFLKKMRITIVRHDCIRKVIGNNTIEFYIQTFIQISFYEYSLTIMNYYFSENLLTH